jgi:hypothetical protein
MARRRSGQADADGSKPKQLRKRLRKAEDQLADAQLKRDRAQARVEALSIIADEIRAQLSEADAAAAKASQAGAAAKPTAKGKSVAGSAATSAASAPKRPVRSAAKAKPTGQAAKPVPGSAASADKRPAARTGRGASRSG